MAKYRVTLIAAAFSLLYLLVQFAYIERLPLVMDEFDGANEAYQLLHLTPYKHYQPYKTVLGYYAEIPPLLVTSDVWTGLMLSKAWLAGINAVALFAAAMAMAALFSPAPALLAQLLLIAVTTFLERSSELRVDMLTAWVGLASFLLLLNRHWFAAGVTAGLSFLVSQKGVYYIAAADVAAVVFWWCEARSWRTAKDVALFNTGAAAAILAYVAFWGVVSSPWTVISTIFFRHYDIAFTQMYDLSMYWSRTLDSNPLYYWGALAGVMVLLLARWRRLAGSTHLMAAAYGAVVFGLCRWHKQPWPYFFVILLPTLMVVHAATLDLLWRSRGLRIAASVAIALAGVFWPLQFMPGILERDHAYQRHVIRLADSILASDETYLAGDDLLYNRRQAPRPLRRLSAAPLEGLRTASADRIDALIHQLEAAPPKLIIKDYRVDGLAPAFTTYLDSHYDHLWSSVWIYAPVIAADQREFEIWFDGDYLAEASSDGLVIDGRTLAKGQIVSLAKGRHRNDGSAALRLKFQPSGFAAHADPAMKRRRNMFVSAYAY